MNNKEQILYAALSLFAQQGYDGAPTSRIAKEAGVSEGLIFRHFGNKAGLLEAIIQLGMNQIADSMQSYQSDLAPAQAIAAHIERSFALVRAHTDFWKMVHKVRFQPVVKELAGRQIEELNRFVVEQLTGHFLKAGAARPQEEALLLFALMDGITIHYVESPAEYPLDAMEQLLINKYINGNILG